MELDGTGGRGGNRWVVEPSEGTVSFRFDELDFKEDDDFRDLRSLPPLPPLTEPPPLPPGEAWLWLLDPLEANLLGGLWRVSSGTFSSGRSISPMVSIVSSSDPNWSSSSNPRDVMSRTLERVLRATDRMDGMEAVMGNVVELVERGGGLKLGTEVVLVYVRIEVCDGEGEVGKKRKRDNGEERPDKKKRNYNGVREMG